MQTWPLFEWSCITLQIEERLGLTLRVCQSQCRCQTHLVIPVSIVALNVMHAFSGSLESHCFCSVILMEYKVKTGPVLEFERREPPALYLRSIGNRRPRWYRPSICGKLIRGSLPLHFPRPTFYLAAKRWSSFYHRAPLSSKAETTLGLQWVSIPFYLRAFLACYLSAISSSSPTTYIYTCNETLKLILSWIICIDMNAFLLSIPSAGLIDYDYAAFA